MSHLSQFRLSAPNMNPDLSTSSNPKKRRKNAQNSIQTAPSIQDLLPPPLSGYGDTIVASNPFDDCPSSINSVNIVRNPPNMGLPNNNMTMNMHMNMCRPMNNMNSPLNIGSPMMHSPNGMQNSHMMNNPMMMNSPRLNGPMPNHMGGHMNSPMLTSPNVNGPMGSPIHPMNSPINNMNPGMNGQMNNPLGPNGINGPGMNGPMSNMNPGMNGHMSNSMGMNSGSNGPMGPNNSVGNNGSMGPGGPLGPHPSHMNNNFMLNPMNTMYSKPMPVSAGKVYPADQPMVFNSQNPNAPPIYPCGVCHKEVHDNDQAILCESGCNFWFHRYVSICIYYFRLWFKQITFLFLLESLM